MSSNLSHRYFPALRSRENEFRGYLNLDDSVKDLMLPIITLSRTRNAVSLEPALGQVQTAANGRPVILDFDPMPRPEKSQEQAERERLVREARAEDQGRPLRPQTDRQRAAGAAQRANTRQFNREVYRLSSPADGYANWREFSTRAPNLIPLVKLADPAAGMTFVEAVSAEGRKVAFKVNLRDPSSLGSFLYAARGLGTNSGAILLLDAGYIREGVLNATRRTMEALDVIRRGLDNRLLAGMTKVSLSGSFPATVADGASQLRILERDLYDALVGEGIDVRYGDYSSLFQRDIPTVAQGWFPHVDLAHPRSWFVNRSAKKMDAQGYVDTAEIHVGSASVWAGRASAWGTEMVARASNGILEDDARRKFTTPGPWIGVRVSQHLTQQASTV